MDAGRVLEERDYGRNDTGRKMKIVLSDDAN